MFKRILVATDGSPCSLRAAQVAGEMARLVPGGEVTVLHVVHVPRVLATEAGLSLDATINTSARQAIDMTVDVLGLPQVQVHTEVQIGEPAEEIVELAATNPFDLIVMGSRGLSPLTELLMGSTSHRVLQTTPCPVLLVR